MERNKNILIGFFAGIPRNTEKYGGALIGICLSLYFLYHKTAYWGENYFVLDKSIDISFILFGFILTVLSILVQGNNSTLQRLKKHKGFIRIITYSRTIVILAAILGFYSFSVLFMLPAPELCNNILFAVFVFLWSWLIWNAVIFLIVFYNIILSSAKQEIQNKNIPTNQ